LQEFELIRRLCAKVPHGRRTILGPGDDCAIFRGGRSDQLVTIDSMVEGVHFKLEWTTPQALGARALTVNLSDIAAMGGTPTICVVNLAIRVGLPSTFFDRMYAGLCKLAAETGVEVVGGNVTRAAQLAITIALIGDAGSAVMRRECARIGDAVYVTGTIGDAALGLAILQGKQSATSAASKFLVNRFLRPSARLAAGRSLARIKPVPAAIDISDGLWQDLGHVLQRSRVGAEIEVEAIPLSAAYRAIPGSDPILALTGGDDYELLFCMRPHVSEAELSRKLGVPVSRIGRIVRGRRARLLEGGRPARTTGSRLGGWDQLSDGNA
jgi:thiamine-monophosphate kinase